MIDLVRSRTNVVGNLLCPWVGLGDSGSWVGLGDGRCWVLRRDLKRRLHGRLYCRNLNGILGQGNSGQGNRSNRW